MKRLIALCTSALLALGLGVGGATAASASTAVIGTVGSIEPWDSSKNQESYWENRFAEHGAECYKDSHGTKTDGGMTVTLPTFDQSWPGDHWEALIIKGGSESVNVIQHPAAGVAYASPVNSGGQQSEVSWFIVCKGTTPTPEKPADLVSYSAWVDGTFECDDTEVVQTRTKTVTTHVLQNNVWVPDTANAVVTTETQTRALTDAEKTECPPDKPADLVSYTAWVDGTFECDDTEVVQTRSKTVTPHVLVENVWVPDTANAVTTTETQTRVLTEDEQFDCPPTFDPTCTTVTGSATIAGDGVISVPGDWASESIAVPFTGTLADIGTVLNIDATPLQYVGLHIDTDEGTIVFEEEPTYDGKLWSTSPWAGVSAGMGYAAFGSIEEFIELNGDVTVTGIRLLYTHPEASSTTVTSFTIGCTIFTFEPAPAPLEGEDVVVGDPDCETETVTTTTTAWTQAYVIEDGEWVLGAKVYAEPTEETRELTEEEALECAGEQPEPETRFVDREVTDCEADFVATLRTTFETPYVLEGTEWVLGEEVQVGVEEQIAVRDATDVECPPVKPEEPKTPEQPRTPEKPAQPRTLAVTGAEAGVFGLGGLAALALLIGAAMKRREALQK